MKRIHFSTIVLLLLMNSSVVFFRRKMESLSFGRTLVKLIYPTHIFKSVCGEWKTDSVVQYILRRM